MVFRIHVGTLTYRVRDYAALGRISRAFQMPSVTMFNWGLSYITGDEGPVAGLINDEFGTSEYGSIFIDDSYVL